MTISSLQRSLPTELLNILSTGQTTATAKTNSTESESTDISQLGLYMRQLGDLLQTDPEAYKTLTGQIADRLEEAAASASESGDTQQAGVLNDLAAKFRTASENGTMVDLRPPGGRPPGPPPMGPPPDSASTDDSGSSCDASNTSSTALSTLFQQGSFSDPLSVLTGILESLMSSDGV
ncbi:MAG: hypothetical protein ACE141_04085 [Bryobacteraceae bacterium]